MKKNITGKRVIVACISFIMLILFDQWTKSLAINHLKGKEPYTLFDGIFQFRYLENRGAAFGMLQGKQMFFVVMALLACAVIGYFYFKLPWNNRFHLLRVSLLFIAAGAVGNLIDRMILGYVVDFFYFELIDFPIFNVADIYVSCATILLACLILFVYKENEFEGLMPFKKEKN